MQLNRFMSIDIDVIPTLDQFFTWANLKSQLLAMPLSNNAAMLLGQNPKLRVLRTKQEVENEQAVLPSNYYYFQLTRENTLILCCDNNAETYTDEQEHLENFGRNLNTDDRLYLSQR